jgi:hypothetical protein
MHYACAYGVSPAVLEVLKDAYPDSLTAKENKGRTPMHLAMVNAHRDASPGVINFLLEHSGSELVNLRDYDGYLPLHLLALGLKGFKADEPEQRSNVSECLKMYLAAEPTASADFLTALQDLPDWLQDVAVVSPHVRNILNKKIVQRFPTAVLMMDGYFLLIIIVFFEIATTANINARFDNPPTPTPSDSIVPLIILFVGGTYFLLRELVQIISLWSLGSVSSWFYDPTNWLRYGSHCACVLLLDPHDQYILGCIKRQLSHWSGPYEGYFVVRCDLLSQIYPCRLCCLCGWSLLRFATPRCFLVGSGCHFTGFCANVLYRVH